MSPEWEAKNERRIYLIEKWAIARITKLEIEELDRFQKEVMDELDRVHPLAFVPAELTEVI